MTRILLLNPPGNVIRTGRLVRQSKISTQSWAPVALAYSCGTLEKLGYDCKLYDASILGTSEENMLGLVREWKPNAIAFFWAFDTRAADLHFAEVLAKEFPLYLVGPWSAHYDALRDVPSAKAMTYGQFEYTLPRLLSGSPATGVKYRGGEYVASCEAYSSSELDWMPFVTDVYRRHLPIEKYHQTSFRHPFVDLYTSRGCVPGTCTFCSVNNGANKLKWQHRSLGNVMEELWWIKRSLPKIRQVFLQDDTLPTPWALRIADQIVAEELDLCWGCYSRADKNYDEIMKMKEAGCRTMHVGYECPDSQILLEIKKGITVDQMTQFAKAMGKAKMWQSMSLMIYPWMSENQIKHMIQWTKDMNPTRVNVAALQVYPGCPISKTIEDLRAEGRRIMSWGEMVAWEKRCFSEFYLRNPEFWWQALTNPGEWRNLIRDAWGMLGFLSS